MKVDFWLLSHDPIERVVTLIAERVLGEGERLLVVSEDETQREALSRGLWKAGPESFLANGMADSPGAGRHPILLTSDCEAANGASHAIFADGRYRETNGLARAFLLFDETTRQQARETWASLDGREDVQRTFMAQENGRWIKKR